MKILSICRDDILYRFVKCILYSKEKMNVLGMILIDYYWLGRFEYVVHLWIAGGAL